MQRAQLGWLLVWPGAASRRTAVGLLAGLVLLWAFYLVVSRSVAEAEARRAGFAEQERQTWRCHLLRDAGQRADCRARLAGAQETKLP